MKHSCQKHSILPGLKTLQENREKAKKHLLKIGLFGEMKPDEFSYCQTRGTVIGDVSMHEYDRYALFEYDPDFVDFGIELAPLKMPLRKNHIYQFEDLHRRSFHGLPSVNLILRHNLPIQATFAS